jgi:hypothetical protein
MQPETSSAESFNAPTQWGEINDKQVLMAAKPSTIG